MKTIGMVLEEKVDRTALGSNIDAEAELENSPFAGLRKMWRLMGLCRSVRLGSFRPV